MGIDHWSALSKVLPCKVSPRFYWELSRFVSIPDLHSFALTASNLITILPIVQRIEEIDPKPDRELIGMASHWIWYCKLMVAHQAEIDDVIPGFCARGKNRHTPPLLGHYEYHPLGVALWCCVDSPELGGRYHLLQAYLSIALHNIRNLEEKRLTHCSDSTKYNACKVVRQLANPENHDRLARLPEKILTIHAYYNELVALESEQSIKRFIHPLKVLFDHALKRRRGVVRAAKKTTPKPANFYRTKPLKETQSLEVVPEVGDKGVGEKVSILSHQGVSDEVLEKQCEAWCTPEEFNASQEKGLLESAGSDPSGGLTFRQQRMKMQMAAAAIAMHNQRLSCDWERLSSHEVSAFLKRISSLRTSTVSYEGIPALELAAFLAVAFWTSSSIERVCHCRFIMKGDMPKGSLHCQALPGKTLQWHITPPVPPLKTKISEEVRRQVLGTVPTLTLEVPRHAEPILKAYRESSAFAGRSGQPRLFNRSDKSYELAAEEFFKVLRHQCGGRQTLQRVSMYLYDALSRAKGSDITLAMAVSDREDVLGRVPLHYTALPVHRIQEVYGDICTGIADGAGVPAVEKTGVSNRNEQQYVGSTLVPARDTIVNLVAELRHRLDVARCEAAESEEKLIRLHNVLTVYTIMLVASATGYREVSDPLFQRAEIDRATGFAVISDKDGDDLYNARIVWLPPVCIDQLDHYQKHLSLLETRLFTMNQDLFFLVRRKAVGGRRPLRENPSFMYLDKNQNGLPLQPRILKSLVGKINYHLKVSAGRHFLRTNLLDQGCSVEVVNAFLGHWERGLEPWGGHSGLSPLDYRNELNRHLVPLLEDLGWKAESGLLED